MADAPSLGRERQSLAYGLLAPLAVLAVPVWLVEGDSLRALATAFIACAAGLLPVFPRALSWAAITPRQWVAGLVLGDATAAVVWVSGAVVAGVLVLMVCLLLRLWYLRQVYRRGGDAQAAELLRRCLLIALWTHLSVFAALVSPY